MKMTHPSPLTFQPCCRLYICHRSYRSLQVTPSLAANGAWELLLDCDWSSWTCGDMDMWGCFDLRAEGERSGGEKLDIWEHIQEPTSEETGCVVVGPMVGHFNKLLEMKWDRKLCQILTLDCLCLASNQLAFLFFLLWPECQRTHGKWGHFARQYT